MKKNLTELVFILDRSGSMSGLESDTIGGFNAMIEKQKKLDGECLVSCVLFSDKQKVIYDRVPLSEVKPMTDDDYTVGGCTALIDALGNGIKHIGNIHKYIREEDVPEHTIFVITTDGMENASRIYSAEKVRKMVSKKTEKYGWEFLYLAANIDAVETGENIGIKKGRAANYKCDGMGTGLLFETVGAAIGSMRSCAKISDDWAEELEEDNKKR
ncbi:MAG: VWA domain-containing protein [Ruminococcaceae bacterium]|nr:VWA domain-containing protein [Oscillospiraceae bacterium]